MFAVVRDRGLCSLANAFVQPVRPTDKRSLVQNAVAALDRYWGRLLEVYSDRGVRTAAVCLVEEADLSYLKKHKVASLEDLIRQVMQTLNGTTEQGGSQ